LRRLKKPLIYASPALFLAAASALVALATFAQSLRPREPSELLFVTLGEKTIIVTQQNKINAQDFITRAAAALSQEPEHGSYWLGENSVLLFGGETGAGFAPESVALIACRRLTAGDTTPLSFPSRPLPQQSALEAAYEASYVAPENASFTQEDGVYVLRPHKYGRELDIEAAVPYYVSGQLLFTEIPLRPVRPQVTSEDIEQASFGETLAHSQTQLPESTTENRKNNVRLATGHIDGLVLLPGDEFSFNGTVGERTEERGFLEAGAFVNGRIEDHVGGGVCQTATTLYIAALYAGLEITERHQHSLAVSYVEPGFDAMVNWGRSDLRFRNNTDEPLRVTMSLDGDMLNADIQASAPLAAPPRFESVVSRVVPYDTVYVDNPRLAAGAEIITQYGRDGCTAQLYRLVESEDGQEPKRVLEHRSTYRPTNEIIERALRPSASATAYT
jgi:vancomycin resistance protein YoaR